MVDRDKVEFICRKINILDLNKREHVVKILLAYEVIPRQTNNGAWCRLEEINAEIIYTIYDYVVRQLHEIVYMFCMN